MMFDPFKKLKLASAFLGVAEDAARTEANLELGEVFGRLDLRSLGLDTGRLLEQDGVRALYDSRYLPQPEPLDRLMELGEGTLGYEVARYLRAGGHTRLVGPPAGFDFKDAAAYLALRVRMTHPIVHILTEYDASPLGELAVQSYYVGQLGNLISGVMISSALLQITRDMPDKLGEALAVMAEAYQRGQTAKPFLGIAWEELWSAQVPQLRELADLIPRTSKIAHLAVEEPPPPPPPPANPRPTATAGSGMFRLTPEPAASGQAAAATTRTANAGSGMFRLTPEPAAQTPARTSTAGSGMFRLTPEPAAQAPARPANAGSGMFRLGPEPAAGDAPTIDRVEPRTRPVSQSKLLASFMALSEEASRAQSQPAREPEPPAPAPTLSTLPVDDDDVAEAEPEPEPELLDPSPARTATRPPPPPPAPPRNPVQIPTRPPSKPYTAPLPQAVTAPAPAPAPAKPGFSVEESDPKIQPALSPDDPDFF